MLNEHFSSLLLNTHISDAVAIKDSVSHGKSVLCYKPQCKSSKQYQELEAEVVERLAKGIKKHAA